MTDNSIIITVDGREVKTLRDILPKEPGLRALFVAKTPTTESVAAGHYFQGTQGKMFWNKLKMYDLLHPTTKFEDDSLLEHEFGITDIVKAPRNYGNEPSDEEYREGIDRILDLIRFHHPTVVVFVYKGVLDQILKLHFERKNKSKYGFNPELETEFGASVFVFPMPGTPCTSEEAVSAMGELAKTLRV